MNMPMLLLMLSMPMIFVVQPEEKKRQATIWLHDGNIIAGHVRGEVVVEDGAEVTIDRVGDRKWKAIVQSVPNQSIAIIRFETPSLGIVLIPLKSMKRLSMLQPAE